MVATPADTGSAVFLRSGHAIGWSPVTWPNLGSISGWNLGCHVRLACRPSTVENKHTCSLHTWSNMEVVRLRHLPSSTLNCYKLMNYELWRAKPLLHLHSVRISRNARVKCVAEWRCSYEHRGYMSRLLNPQNTEAVISLKPWHTSGGQTLASNRRTLV
jgi:hypothetical protein